MASALWTKDEVLEEAGRIRELLRQMFDENGSLRAVTYLYATRNPESGEDSKGLVLMPVLGHFDKDDRQEYALMLRLIARGCRAVGVIFASEVWTVDPAYHKEIGYERALKEAREWTGSLENHPRRVEGIWVNVEHHRLTGHHTWFAKITRDAEGKPTLGKWEEQNLDGKAQGRFINMLPPVN